MQQVFVIHGGEAFDSYEEYLEHLKSIEVSLEDLARKGWKSGLAEKLGPEYQIVAPRFPNSLNARYAEWKIWFGKYIPLLDNNVIFLGHSLGGVFLTKYLSEETYPKSIRAAMLVAAPYNTPTDWPYADFNIITPLTRFAEQGGQIFLYHSEDDPVVPFSELAKYRSQLPNATVRTFTDRGHFNTEEFPELVEDIRSLV